MEVAHDTRPESREGCGDRASPRNDSLRGVDRAATPPRPKQNQSPRSWHFGYEMIQKLTKSKTRLGGSFSTPIDNNLYIVV